MRSGAIEHYLIGLKTDYGSEEQAGMIRRFTTWRATGDTVALLWSIDRRFEDLLTEIKALRESLERQPARRRP